MKKKTCVFISFEFGPDKALRDLLLGQSKHPETPFDVIDNSLHEAKRESEWKAKATEKIKPADVMIVLIGPTTYKAPGVLKEIEIAHELNKKIVQLIGYKNGKYKRVPGAGILYRWTWENLQKILQID